ncbi:hypothetical protein JN11_02092 [Mucilaginibacter frigoritolerans]|uniref:PH (Pleckstrin Homology) domain-containing protein n=1 Tax=Mucilaginibacter frigoritolerans TaxID=652788 RepID=A0A562U4T3_9SPHI|nr:hypothetical protein [Mucilaginibacter frigoritolerans]TWJ00832.1 hypothetical protein JN11_02092 [Mucilaginibacter frigoritolerans]
MTEPVTSKFASYYWLKVTFLSIFVPLAISACLWAVIVKHNNYSQVQLIAFTLFPAWLVLLYIYQVVFTCVRITTAPEGLIWLNLLTKKRMVINYSDIEHVDNHKVIDNNRGMSPFTTAHKLVIELSTGKFLSFKDDQYANYEELKEAVRRRRFNLD